jgi:hypothetical protein
LIWVKIPSLENGANEIQMKTHSKNSFLQSRSNLENTINTLSQASLWLDANKDVQTRAGENELTAIKDQVSNRNFDGITDADLLKNGLNNRDVLDFASGDRVTKDGVLQSSWLGENNNLFFVKKTATDNSSPFFASGNLKARVNNGKIKLEPDKNGLNFTGNTNIFDSKFHLINLSFGSNGVNFRIDGQQDFSSTDSTTMDLTQAQSIALGSKYPSPYWSCQQAEIIAFKKSLTEAEKISVENYLTQKYGLINRQVTSNVSATTTQENLDTTSLQVKFFDQISDTLSINENNKLTVTVPPSNLSGDKSGYVPLSIIEIESENNQEEIIINSLTYIAQNLPAQANIIISEISWAGSFVSSDDQWIELYNHGTENINLENFVIEGLGNSTNPNLELNNSNCSNLNLESNKYYLISKFNSDDAQTTLNIVPDCVLDSLEINKTGEALSLKDLDNRVLDSVEF